MRTNLFALAILFLSPAFAYADVVGPEPSSCPLGSRPSVAHSGPYCAPLPECTSDSACSAGAACMEVSQCIEIRGCGGRPYPDAEPCTLEHVVGPCGGDGSCATGTCTTRSVCTSGGGSDGGCGCSAAGAPRSLAVAPVLALFALLFAIRRGSPSGHGARP